MLLLLLLACAVSTRPENIDDDTEWGIFAALRNAQSCGDTTGQECSCCSCCHVVEDLRRRVVALERGIAQLTGQQASKSPAAAHCPSVPAVSAATVAAANAAPALAHMQASYCSEWVSLLCSPKPACASVFSPDVVASFSLSGRPKRRQSLPCPTADQPRTRSALVWSAAMLEWLRQRRRSQPPRPHPSRASNLHKMFILLAVEALLASAALQPSNVQAHLLLSRIFRGQRKLNCAVHHVLEMLKTQGDGVDALAALAFLLQHTALPAASAASNLEIIASASIPDIQQRLCAALHAAAAVHSVVLPASICSLAPPALLMQSVTYSSQWSNFFRADMAGHMQSHSFVPGCVPVLLHHHYHNLLWHPLGLTVLLHALHFHFFYQQILER